MHLLSKIEVIYIKDKGLPDTTLGMYEDQHYPQNRTRPAQGCGYS